MVSSGESISAHVPVTAGRLLPTCNWCRGAVPRFPP